MADGSNLSIAIVQTDRGYQVAEVYEIEPPELDAEATMGLTDMTREEIAELPLVAARIKWFDRAKGFGFANVFGEPEDVFVHLDVARRAGLGDLQCGEAVAMRVGQGERGKLAVEVLTWQHAEGEE